MHQLDIIVPVKNEAANLPELIRRVDVALHNAKISYQLTIVDDASSDDSKMLVKGLAKNYPVVFLDKKGKPGKAFSILEGLEATKAAYVGMLDGDLEYPPEAIPAMFAKLSTNGLVVANRLKPYANPIRRLASRGNSFVFGRLMLGFNCDVQSGLKLFRREVFENLNQAQIGAWSIDMPLIHTTRELGYSISQVDIEFTPRTLGKSKLKQQFFTAVREIGGGAIKLKFTKPRTIQIPATSEDSSLGAGIIHNRNRFVTHSQLPQHLSALETLLSWQKYCILAILVAIITGFFINPLVTGITLVAILTSIYFVDVIFNLYLILKSLHFPPELAFTPEQLGKLKTSTLPVYSILCPLYKEAHVLPQFLENIDKLDWPKNKLDVMLLLEEDDATTIEAAKKLDLPKYVRILVVPHSQPKTKPKACNYGLAHARGEYLVVYDAEDRPEPNQLKTAYLGFHKSLLSVACLQAKLNYYNPHQNILTRLFTAEYSLWFDVVLPGLQSVNTSIPLGGTSNHFKTKVLKDLQGWDAFNVTEDCDLGARLFKAGYTTAIIDSVTLEEANSKFGNWLRQRSRWIKGYIQTFLVHNRNPVKFVREHGVHAFIFQLVVGGKIAFMLINPFLWLATIAYFGLYAIFGPTIESLYPTWVFYMAATSLVFGNFMFLYYYMIGAAKRGHWTIIKFVFLIPFYWLAVSIAAFKAFVQLIFKPHYWEKTVHGLDKKIVKEAKQVTKVQLSEKLGWVKKLTSSSYLSAGFLVLAALFSNFFGFLYNAYLGRSSDVSVAEFGLISLFGSLLSLIQIPSNSLIKTVTYRSAYLLGKHKEVIRRFWVYMQSKMLVISIVATILWILSIPLLHQLFHTSDNLPFFLFSPIIIIGALGAVNSGYLSGNQKFGLLALASILEAVTKFIFTVIFVNLKMPQFIYLAIPLSMIISFIVAWQAARLLPAKETILDTKTVLHFPWRFFGTSVLSNLASTVFLSIDIVLAKIYLSPVMAGQYALISLIGKMVYLFGSLFSQFITPMVSRAEGAGEKTNKSFYWLLFATVVSSLFAFTGVGLLNHFTIPLLFGAKANPILSYLPWYCLAMVAFTTSSSIVNYHQIRKHYIFPVVGFLLSLLEILALVNYHTGLESVVMVVSAFGGIYLAIICLLHLFYDSLIIMINNLIDFVGLFVHWPRQKYNENKLKVLIFNWRDTKHTWAGGAEVYVHELAKRWVVEGHQVTIFCGNDGKTIRNEVMDGVHIIRRGGFYTVYIWAFLYYMIKLRGLYDVVIDSENGVPFFTPLYVRKPKFLLIHHVHQEVFRSQLKWPASWIAMFIESRLMPLAYFNSKVITVSESSKKDIVKLGLSKPDDIEVINPGIELAKFHTSPKTKYPSFLYLGRIRPYKNIDIAIKAFAKITKKYPTAKLTIAGWGESLPKLKQLAKDLKLTKSVIFAEKVSEEEKIKLLGQSWAMIQPSSFEGWGITVIEANACGTPVIATDAIGLRDSVLHDETGVLIPIRNDIALAKAMVEIITNKDKTAKLSKNSVAWAYNFDWSNISTNFLDTIKRQLIKKMKVNDSQNIYMVLDN